MAAKTQKKPTQKKSTQKNSTQKKPSQAKTPHSKTARQKAAKKKPSQKKKTSAVVIVLAGLLLIAQLFFHSPIPDELAPLLEKISGGAITESQFTEAKGHADRLKDSISQFFPDSSQPDSSDDSTLEGSIDDPLPVEPLPQDILSSSISVASLADLPEYCGDPVVVLNDNTPYFTPEDLIGTSFESYSALDGLGRCGVAYANIGTDLMPTDKREAISSVRPAGWHSVKYDCVEGKYLYNRCHLIGYQLTGENANEKNLITGTRYLNVTGMLPYENMVAEYVQETGNHVLYRVTPVYEGDELLARGLVMEAKSVEDDGAGVCFHIYAYNVQPGVEIDYATGESWLAE